MSALLILGLYFPTIYTERTVDFSGINVIKIPVRLTLSIISIGLNIGDVGLVIPIGEGTIVTRVTKVI